MNIMLTPPEPNESNLYQEIPLFAEIVKLNASDIPYLMKRSMYNHIQ